MQVKKTLDNVPRLVFWRIDDAAVFLVPFSLGVLFGSLSIITAAGLCVFLYRRTRKRGGNVNYKAKMYWLFGAGFPKQPSHVRRIRR